MPPKNLWHLLEGQNTKNEIEGIEALLIEGQLRWAGHLTHMEENRIPKALFYGELVGGQRSRVALPAVLV